MHASCSLNCTVRVNRRLDYILLIVLHINRGALTDVDIQSEATSAP